MKMVRMVKMVHTAYIDMHHLHQIPIATTEPPPTHHFRLTTIQSTEHIEDTQFYTKSKNRLVVQDKSRTFAM